MSSGARRNEPCPCGSGKKYKRCCLDRERRPNATAGAKRDPASGELVLFIETDSSVMVRRIPDAMALPSGRERGPAAEEATHDAAAIWSVPDFVYAATVRKVGRGSREIGDRFLIVGDMGVVVQVKSREALTPDPEKEQRWIEKHVGQALRQARGTVRALRREPELLRSARGREILVDGNHFKWIAAVIVDHPEVPDGVSVGDITGSVPAVVMLRRDWEFLFDQLKSVQAVSSYLERVAGKEIDLGDEPMRYYDLAAADADTPPGPINPAIAALGVQQLSMPQLPMEPVAHADAEAHFVVRMLFEDVATSPALAGEITDDQRLKTLAELDRLPVGYREEIGRYLLQHLEQVEMTEEGLEWRARRYMGSNGDVHLGFAVFPKYSTEVLTLFGAWVELRHTELQRIVEASEDLTTVGVLLTPRGDGKRPWDTTVVTAFGDLGLSDEDLERYRSVWKRQDDPAIRAP